MSIRSCLFYFFIFFLGGAEARLYFIHIAKTGGSSMRALLEKEIHVSELYPRRMPVRTPGGSSPSITQEIVSGHFPLSFCERMDPDFDQAYKFVILREPIDRYLSFLRYRKRNNPSFKTLEAVLSWVKQTDDRSNLLCKFIASHPEATGEELLQSAKENIHRFDFVIFFDHFAEDVKTLCERIGRSWEEESLPHLNTTEPEPVSPELLAEVIRLNELDIAFYEYAKKHYKPKNTSYQFQSPFYTNFLEPKDSIDYTFHSPLRGMNWCYREKVNAFSAHQPIYRYVMDKPAKISFSLEPNREYLLKFTANPIAQDIEPRVLVNGVELQVQKIDNLLFSTYQCSIPSLLVTENLTTFTFFSSKFYQPNLLDPKSGDNRKLSFAMDRIQILPKF